MFTVDDATLQAVGETVIEALGATPDIARDVADHLVDADRRGHGSHGVRMIPIYASLIEEGELVPDATPTTNALVDGCVSVDGRRSFGQVAGRVAVDRAIEEAAGGLSLVGVGNTTHLGRIGRYGERAAEAGMLFVALVNVPETGGEGPVAPLGSTAGGLGTNPLCFAVPPFDALPHPVVVDVASSQVAIGKVRRAAASGTELEPEWTTDPNGEPVTDPEAYFEGDGVLLPLGGRTTGHKGFGLAVAAELFGSLVGDGFISGQSDIDWGNHAAFFVADPTVFSDRNAIEDRLDAFAAHLQEFEYDEAIGTGKSSRSDRGALPGWPEYRSDEKRRREGVPMPDDDLTELARLAREHGVGDVIPSAWPEQ